ncbi:MAG TPA: ferredoxin--NADP reductase [Nitrococcus sp.]|nr:ferredoxin--NADP reductase [Nitrococcus sp.]
MAQKQFQLILQSARMITPRVRELTFVREDQSPMDYTPGQFITLFIDFNGERLRRSYSIASIPGSEPDEIRIAVTYVEGGRATARLFNIEPGEHIQAMGPFGRLVLREDPPGRYLLVATGTGVSPYRAMLRELGRRIELEDFSVELLLGVRGPGDLLYGDEFVAFASQRTGFTFRACYSREMPQSAGEFEHSGYVQKLLPQMRLNPQRDIVYLCGNPDMIDEATSFLTESGFSMRNVRREKYVSSN